jgi:hypothetical protein|tara:strand:+ start:422 stop:601 length:180 start_codon:yes stop_codon:yes gene_type:complete
MITVKNETKQGREVIFRDGQKYIHYWLSPRASVSMPETFITETLHELARRKVVSLQKTN